MHKSVKLSSLPVVWLTTKRIYGVARKEGPDCYRHAQMKKPLHGAGLLNEGIISKAIFVQICLQILWSNPVKCIVHPAPSLTEGLIYAAIPAYLDMEAVDIGLVCIFRMPRCKMVTADWQQKFLLQCFDRLSSFLICQYGLKNPSPTRR